MNVKAISKKVAGEISKNLPTIATGAGIAGFITTVALAIKIAPKAKKAYTVKTTENPDMKPMEKAKIIAKEYWPVALSGSMSIACFIFANHVHLKRNAAAIAAYQVSEAALNSFREAAVKTVGEKKTKDIEYTAAGDKIRLNPVAGEHVFETGHGATLCYDSLSGRYFHCCAEWIRHAVNEINRQLLNNDTAALNDFYDEVGLPQIEMGDMLGWNVQTENDRLEISFTSHLMPDADEPALVISYRVKPTYDYFSFY